MLLALICGAAGALAHEEKLVIGRVEVIDRDKKVRSEERRVGKECRL